MVGFPLSMTIRLTELVLWLNHSRLQCGLGRFVTAVYCSDFSRLVKFQSQTMRLVFVVVLVLNRLMTPILALLLLLFFLLKIF